MKQKKLYVALTVYIENSEKQIKFPYPKLIISSDFFHLVSDYWCLLELKMMMAISIRHAEMIRMICNQIDDERNDMQFVLFYSAIFRWKEFLCV